MQFLSHDGAVSFGSGLLILYFYTLQSPYHSTMINLLEKTNKDYSQIKFYAIDADFFEGLCRRFEIKAIPTLIALNNGKIINRIVGLPKYSCIADICNSIGEYDGKEGK